MKSNMKTQRRSPKPFTIEIRRAGRQAAAASINQQPAWPALPAETETAKQRAPGSEPTMPTVTAPIKRILPALNDPVPVVAAAEKTSDRQRKPKNAEQALQSKAEKTPESTISTAMTSIEVDASEVPLPLPKPLWPKGRLSRLPRSAFPLGERWKARFPAISVKRAVRGSKG